MCTSVRGAEASGAKLSTHKEGHVGARDTIPLVMVLGKERGLCV